MEYNYNLTQQRITEADAANDAAFLEAYNAATVETFVPVSSVDVASYLMETLSHKSTQTDLLTLYNILSLTYRNDVFSDTVRAHAENMIDLATGVERMLSLHNNPMYQIATGSLVAVNQWTQDEATGLITFGKRMVSQSAIDHGRETTQTDLAVMRNQEKRALCVAFFDESRAAFDRAEQAIFRLDRGEDVDLESEVFNPPAVEPPGEDEVSDGD